MALLYMPFFTIALAAGGLFLGSTDEEKKGTCYFLLFIFWYTVLVILMTFAAMSFDQFLLIVKPHLLSARVDHLLLIIVFSLK